MKQSKITTRYAKSLLGLVLEKNLLEETVNDMKLIKSVCSTNKDFSLLLKSPIVKIDKKLTIFNKIFSDTLNESQLHLVFCLLENIDFKYLEIINKKYQKLIADSIGKVNIKAVTVSQLTGADLLDLEAQIKTKINTAFTLDNITDKSIIGGIKLRIGNTLIDGSL